MTTPRLITILFSHFCEKARWALDACGVTYEEDGHLPLFHYLATIPARASRTVPALVVDGKVLPDSTDIVAWADAQRPGTLIPERDPERADALALEDDFDRHLGPATRRWAYFHSLDDKELLARLVTGAPRWERTLLRLTRPLAVRYLKRGLKIDAAGAARSKAKIDETFAHVGALLGDGRRYLMGDRFTVADLTFAALAAPVLLPAEYGAPLPPLDSLPAEARRQVEIWRGSAPGEHALRVYAEHRRPARAAAA